MEPAVTHRFFRAAEVVCESVRVQLNEAWGLPSQGQVSCFAAAPDAPRDANGKCLLAVPQEFCEYEAVATVLPDLIASGSVAEITEAEYWAAVAGE